MPVERGSTWKKWDFHVHTPYSILNNNYGFDPYSNEDPVEESFDTFVKELFTRAIKNEIAAIGITDYFSIEGYKRIRNDYLSNPIKMERLFPDEKQRSAIESILVFPNIELRLDSFVGDKNHSINYHVMFSDKVHASDIEDGFLHRLTTIDSPGTSLPITRASIERLGQESKRFNPEPGSDYLVGLKKVTVNYQNIIDTLNACSALRGQFLITVPVDEDLSSVNWQGRDYYTRKVLYQQCHLLLTSNEKTRNWALAQGNEKEFIGEFGSIKPCIWGSDAHEYTRLFAPKEDRFCWVKAEASFEGLQQILYEPADRVRIAKDRPEDKDVHQLIDYILFEDERFQNEPIYLSEGLTCIIGGKSTGKSILLRHIAKAADPAQVLEVEHRVYGSKQLLEATAQIVWKDGESGARRIIYIPQSWLNRIVDENDGDSALNKMVRKILLQQDTVNTAYGILERKISEIEDSVKHNILDYTIAVQKINDCERQLLDHGRSAAYKASIAKLEAQRAELSAESGITPETLEHFNALGKEISLCTETLNSIDGEKPVLEFAETPYVYIPGITKIQTDGTLSYDLERFPTVRNVLEEAIQRINKTILEIWDTEKVAANCVLEETRESVRMKLDSLEEERGPLNEIVEKNEQLQKIENQLKEETTKFKQAQQIEQEKNTCSERAAELKKTILESRQTLKHAYDVYKSTILSVNEVDTELEFGAEIGVKENDLFNVIGNLFDNRGFRGFKDKYGYSLLVKDDFIVKDDLFEKLWEAMTASGTSGALSFKSGNTLQVALERLFSDWYYIHYIVKSGNDTINSMSPGKKALVLLEMIVSLEKGNCPILIDQPEDDLDNRSIYADLVQYLKQKKHERQIIVVTHNANVVIGADAEEVIIANQDGNEAKNKEKRFEYRCGAIENTQPCVDERGQIVPGVLNQKGIQEQICDILEGGKEAFELRRNKYSSAL